jgi:hypothetical protein
MYFHIHDKRYLQPWLTALQPLNPEELWRRFTSLDKLPSFNFSLEASAVYSSNIEGNTIDLDSFGAILQRKSTGILPEHQDWGELLLSQL